MSSTTLRKVPSMKVDNSSNFLDRLMDFETKDRHVRTADGARYFGVPIGTRITLRMRLAKGRGRGAPDMSGGVASSAGRAANMAHMPDAPKLPSPSKLFSPKEKSFLEKIKGHVDLKDGKGPVEAFLRKNLDKIGIDPYDIDMKKLDKHADDHDKSPKSRFWFKSPCWASRDTDFAVHKMLPMMLAEKHPELAEKLKKTSPRWSHISVHHGRHDSKPNKVDTPGIPDEAHAAIKDINVSGRAIPPATGTAKDPIDVFGDLDAAIKHLSEGKHVRLNQEAEVSTMLAKLSFLVDNAKKRGDKAPNINLCHVSVPGTNLFCAQSKGIERAKMPQLSGTPVPGSPAALLMKPGDKEANIVDGFRAALEARGIKVERKRVLASHLRASQAELDGPKVAGMVNAMLAGKIPEGAIFVTRDGYIIDGHHRWASQVTIDSRDGKMGDIDMPVDILDMDIGAALDFANAFAASMGIHPKGLGSAADSVAKKAHWIQNHINNQIVLEYKTRHVRTPSGVRTFKLPIGSPIIDRPDLPRGRSLGGLTPRQGLSPRTPSTSPDRASVPDSGGAEDAMAIPPGSPLRKVPNEHAGFSKFEGGGQVFHIVPYSGQFAIVNEKLEGVSIHKTRALAIAAMHKIAMKLGKTTAKKKPTGKHIIKKSPYGFQDSGTVPPHRTIRYSRPDTQGQQFGAGAAMNDQFLIRFQTNTGVRPARDQADIDAFVKRTGIKIPPQWSNVHIADDPNNGLQAWGQDQRQIGDINGSVIPKNWNKAQPIMSKQHSDTQKDGKFLRGVQFAKDIHKLDAVLPRDATRDDSAAVVAIMRATGMRVGSSKDASGAHKSYGATTLLVEHVTIEGGAVHFRFIGKHGVPQHVITKNPAVIAAIRIRLAQNWADDESLFDADDASTMKYLRKVMPNPKGEPYINHDLRTHIANLVAAKTLKEITQNGKITADTKEEFLELRAMVGEAVAKQLGNKPKEALDSYIDPEVFFQYLKDGSWLPK